MLRARKRFGQHFLAPEWVDKLVAAIDPRPQDRFLEIGPGPGALTLRLAGQVEHLTAIELDRDLVAGLAPRLPPNVSLIQADFLNIDLDTLVARGPMRVAGNLPYNIASPILFRLIDTWRRRVTTHPNQKLAAVEMETRPWNDATLMLQREVADRIEASPGTRDYGVLSISVRLHAEVRRVLTLPPGAFRPAPDVHSAVLQLVFRAPAVALRDEQVFEQMVRSVFTQRRKTLGNALTPFASSRHSDARAALKEAGIDPGRRAETLQLTELARLADYFAAARGAN
jgi:16S rRNA (adenine1518-N6/adenine1519-N6)-dimethyltransferase